MPRHRIGRLTVALLTLLTLTLAGTAQAEVKPLKFIERVSSVTGEHPTSGLAGFPARDYLARGGSLVRAPFSGCVPTNRPWGWLAYQSPNEGFGGARVYLTQTKTGRQGYFAHFGNPAFGGIFLKPGQCFRQGDPMGHLWAWPGNPGRSHIHFGWTGGDPLPRVVDRHGNFLIREGPVWKPGPDGQIFPRPILRHEGKWWRVQVGEKRVYQGGEEKAQRVYGYQKLARRINLHFRRFNDRSPLIGWGLPMVRAFRARDVDPRLGAALATCETSAGTKGDGPAVNNDFGLLVWNPKERRAENRRFKSRKHAIVYLADLLDEKYIGQGFDTLLEISGKYAPVGASNDPRGVNRHHLNCVARWYKHLNGTRYLQPEPEPVELPRLAKVSVYTAQGKADEPGYWRCSRDGKTLIQTTYRPANAFCDDKRAYWQRKAA